MTLTFVHSPVPRHQLQQVTLPEGRHYIDDDGNRYDSVTTILKRASDTTWLENWRNKVGHEVADQISRCALDRGIELHQLAEDFLVGKDSVKKVSPFKAKSFRQFRACLQANVTTIYGIELPLHSKVLRAAGTTDLFFKLKGTRAIVDYKTCKDTKQEKEILDYFIQAATYSWMSTEMYKEEIPLVVIIMVPDGGGEIDVFERKSDDYNKHIHKIFIGNRL